MKPVGYWIGGASPSHSADQYPDPTTLVDHTWCIDERDSIVEYLRNGNLLAHWRGLSYCRFNCGTPSTEMGSRCLTDGTWSWPEGLPRYIVAHDVRLPDEFIAHMRDLDWIVPQCDVEFDRDGRDFDGWISWGRSQR